ncbi:hypothetical protein J010_00033 [Cryptococcus neoformans]|nr:hypothetical protein J010_00033 [Cryptococcus neoformans var. grubii]
MESAQTSSASATNPAAASSIASLLYHDGPAHEADNHGLIDYLQSHGDYANDINHYHAQPSHGHGHSQRSPSPPDPSIPIPSSLNRLANTALAHYVPPALPPLPGAIDQAAVAAAIDYGDRGEMGGKRRKLPHQRAGWADMENSQNKKRRTRKSEDAPHLVGSNAGGSASPAGSQRASAGVQGEVQIPAGQDLSSLTELSRMALEGVTGDTLQTQEVQEPKPQQATHEIDPTSASVHEPRPAPPPEPPISNEKLSRAEQNKRAQQAFRRRREEHMKRLEAESAQLQVVLKQCQEKDLIIKDLVLGQQTDRIRIAALESLIKHFAPHVNIPLLTPEGDLNIPEDPIATSGPSGDDSVADVGERRSDRELERAFDVLERQSREVAKVNFKL